jgi:hypothetical protein
LNAQRCVCCGALQFGLFNKQRISEACRVDRAGVDGVDDTTVDIVGQLLLTC